MTEPLHRSLARRDVSAAARMKRTYSGLAIIVLNTIVLFLVLNVALYLANAVRTSVWREEINPEIKYGNDLMRRAYPEWSPKELRLLMAEFPHSLTFEPFTHFKERPVRGKYVNVDPGGFRFGRDQGPWPIGPGNFNLFFFGGSTAFGYGLPDDQTIASYLQEILSANLPGRRIFVYNFGRGYYFSTQERIVLEQLITSGHRPDLAVFLDGLNDFLLPDGYPGFADRLAAALDGSAVKERAGFLENWPVTKAAHWIRRRLHAVDSSTGPRKVPQASSRAEDSALAKRVIERWLANKAILEAIGERVSFRLLFVWQPIPSYGFDLAYHPFVGREWPEKYALSMVGYPMVRDQIEAEKVANFLWLGDMQRERKEVLYVDQLHYNAKFGRSIAQRIADRILADGLQHAR